MKFMAVIREVRNVSTKLAAGRRIMDNEHC